MSDVLADRRAASHASLHGAAAERVAALDQRYTASRRALVHALLEAERPLTITEILAGAKGMPQSSAYRNLTVLCEAGVARRLPGVDDLGRFELAEDLAGHHPHLQCTSCGTLVDFAASAQLERALVEAARRVASETGYDITGHRLDFDGRCPSCH
ncbi:MAG: transcriptional repressor [Acidimicrobiales bacterium]|nr:transcriptional repressor [Acidimicrobiales bacterium]